MDGDSLPIVGGDYEHGGAASGALKQRLKRTGAPPGAIRRAIIAAYEAEMNVVVHASRGTLRYALAPDRLEVEVDDAGPGIPDVARAMQEGFSTAPAEARALGFGAGMGLPNIRRNSDRLDVYSAVGRGTRVTFTVFLQDERLAVPAAARAAAPALTVDPMRCTGCLRCLPVCPTRALRVRGITLLPHLCVDCGACVIACQPGALGLPDGAPAAAATPGETLALPAAFLAQFGAAHPPDRVRAALGALGYGPLVLIDDWEDALRAACGAPLPEDAAGAAGPRIAPLCPAVVNLIELRFPSLLPQVPAVRTPLAALRRALGIRAATIALPCPAQWAALEDDGLPGAPRRVSVAALREAVWPVLSGNARTAGAAGLGADRDRGSPTRTTGSAGLRSAGADNSEASAGDVRTGGPPSADTGGSKVGGPTGAALDPPPLRVTGLRHVLATLEAIEDGRLSDVPLVELWVCDEGCAGAPLFREVPTLALRRLAAAPAAGAEEPATVTPLAEPLAAPQADPLPAPRTARPGLRLDEDMATAIAKLAQMDALVRVLAGRDCGQCGAPTCAAFAEDVVLGRAELAACPYPLRPAGT
jgi:anti-sigma regulatory factor (Ser/Thr protein kinase)/NAD-dependent dihydropyrimidine dehydrogenase PreA subunit